MFYEACTMMRLSCVEPETSHVRLHRADFGKEATFLIALRKIDPRKELRGNIVHRGGDGGRKSFTFKIDEMCTFLGYLQVSERAAELLHTN